MSFIKKEAKHVVSFLEKWTELDVMYYFRGGAWLFSTQFLLVLTSFLLFVGFARLTSKDLFGQFQFVLAILGTFSSLALPGANTAVFLGVAQKKDGTLLQGIKLKLKWSLLGIIGLLVTAGYFYFRPGYEHVWPIFLVAILFFPIIYTFDAVHFFFAGRRKFSWSCLFQIPIEAGSAFAALVSLFFTKNLITIITIYLAVQAVGYLFALRFARENLRNKKTDAEFASYSTHLTVINFIPYLRTYFDKLIVTYFLGFAATAVYTIGAAMSEQLYAVSKNVGNIVFPKLAELKGKKIYAEVKKRTGKLAIFFILVAFAAILLAPFLIPFFFSAQYAGAVPIAQLLLLVGIPRAIAFVLTRVQEARRQKGRLYTINACYSGVEILALLVLTPFYGMYGVVGAKAVSNLTYIAIAWRSLR